MATLQGKVALVVGGSKGIGRASVTALSKAGAQVAFVYGSDVESANKIVDELGNENSLAIQTDASSIDGAEEMVTRAVEKFGRLDMVVLCAGTSPMLQLEQTSSLDFDKAVQINVKGPYFIAQKAAVAMHGGSIVFVSSSLNHYSGVGAEFLLYCTCKGAMDQMTRLMAKGLSSRGIRVNAVAPGPVDGEHFRRGKTEEQMEKILSSVPTGKLATAEEIADVILFLCSPQSSLINGQIVHADGGMT